MSVDSGGRAFDDEDVARAYQHRPPYPDELFTILTDLPSKRLRALDLGCGPGTIAHQLAHHFERVDAVDLSLPMLQVADDGRHANIRWIHGAAETVSLEPPYDLVTAGASIHWMDHAVVFPRLAVSLATGGVVAVIEGDDAHEPAWNQEWEIFLERWLTRLGREYDPEGFRDRMESYQVWLEIDGAREFSGRVSQSIEDFIACQHSRATWSRNVLGEDLSARFDAELQTLLRPFATDGQIHFDTLTTVVWGRPRESIASASLDY